MVLYSQLGNGTDLVLTKDGVSVTIYVTDVTINLNKANINIMYPKTTGKQSSNPSDPEYAELRSRVIDILNKVEFRVTVTGFLDSDDATTTADVKRLRLIRMFLSGAANSSSMITITSFEGSLLAGRTCAIDKFESKRLNSDNVEGPGVATHQVTFSMVIGTFDGSALQF